uniref:Uncharacterized protein n=1 Tax=Arundo donax TaxID=35708 RepID=A0A0A9BXP0_ARUDO
MNWHAQFHPSFLEHNSNSNVVPCNNKLIASGNQVYTGRILSVRWLSYSILFISLYYFGSFVVHLNFTIVGNFVPFPMVGCQLIICIFWESSPARVELTWKLF